MRRGRRSMAMFAALGVLAGSLLVLAVPVLAAPETRQTVSPAKPITVTTATLGGALDPHATSPIVPTVSTGEAQNITLTTATLSGTVNPEGAETTYYFEYVSEARYQVALAEGASDLYAAGETTTPASAGSSTEPQTVGPASAAGLLSGTTYHFRVVAHNEYEGKLETSYGNDATFTTLPPTLPTVGTGGAGAISQNKATLSGTVSTNGMQTSYGFEIGTEAGNYGPATGLGSIGGANTEMVSVALSELQPGTTYYYRVTATNANGTVEGQPESFTTLDFPTLIAPPSSAPLIAAASTAFPKEEKTSTTTTKKLTNAEKLGKALKACKRDKKSKRAACVKRAHRKFTLAKKRTKA